MTIQQKLALAATIALLGSCRPYETVYRDSWESVADDGEVKSRVVKVALLVAIEDLQALRDAGAELIGWHEVRGGWALRAASTGGTHFVPISQTAPTSGTACYSWDWGNAAHSARWGSGFTSCSAWEKEGAWTRIAVLRLEPMLWHELPARLIPPSWDFAPDVHASAMRTDCIVNRTSGRVQCGNEWTVRRSRNPTPKQPPSAPAPAEPPPAPAEPSPEPTEPTPPLDLPTTTYL